MSRDHLGGNHAVVIGASIVGMLAARVLANHFERVTIVERDPLPEGPEWRASVPQAHHVHALLGRGAMMMEQLFPGLFAQLVQDGALRIDQMKDVQAYQNGAWKDRYHSGFYIYCVSRPLLEWTIRQRLSSLGNVRILDQSPAERLITTGDRRIVSGVELSGEYAQNLAAELVVDAGGRGSRLPQWLDELGYGMVPTSMMRVDLGYASQVFLRPQSAPDWKALTISARGPEARCGSLLPVEGNRWIATVWGYFGDHPSAEREKWLEFMAGLPVPDLFNAVKDATPVGPVMVHRFHGHLRRHYERLERFPEGLAALGDAVCSFTPMYAQGMTTGAQGALELDACLKAQPRWQISGLSQRFRQRLARVVEIPWQLVTAAEGGQRPPDGRRAPAVTMMSKYTQRLMDAAARDRELNDTLLQVINQVKPPATLFAPGTVAKVMGTRLPAAT